MAQIIAPSVQLQLDDQYNQHYDSAINVPFQINPANELKPLGVMAEAFAQYEDKLAESESNIEAQTALNKFNEYKAQRLTDLAQMPVGKAVDAYKGLDNDLQNYAKICGQNITSPKAKNKFDISAGSAVSDGKIRGYALHAEQVTKHEANVDAASIDNAAQDVASTVGTPVFQEYMEAYKGSLDVYADKYGFTPEEKISYQREQTKKVFVNAGTNLITTKQFGKCAQILHDNQSEMDQYTYNDLLAKMKAAQQAEAEHQAAKAQAKRNQEQSDLLQLFSASIKAGQNDDAKGYAGEIGKINPALGNLLQQQAKNNQAQTALQTYHLATKNDDGSAKYSSTVMLLNNMQTMSSEDRDLLQQQMLSYDIENTVKANTARSEQVKNYINSQKELLKNYKAANEYQKAGQATYNIRQYDPDLAESLAASLSKDAVEYYQTLIKTAEETGNDVALNAGQQGVNTYLPQLGTDNQINYTLKQRQDMSDVFLKQAEEATKTNAAVGAEMYRSVLNNPYATQIARQKAQTALQGLTLDVMSANADRFVTTKDGASLGAMLYTKDAAGNTILTDFASQLGMAEPEKLASLQASYEKINADAIADEHTSAVKNKGFSPQQRETALELYLSQRLDGDQQQGQDGLVTSIMQLRGIKDTDANRKALRAELKDRIMPEAALAVQKQSDTYYEAKVAEGAVYMSSFRNAERALNVVLDASQEMRMAVLTTTNPFSLIPQTEQDKILSSFANKKDADEFVENFNYKYSNHAQGNPQTFSNVIADIDAGKYNDLDPKAFSKELQDNYKDLSVTQINEIEKNFKESLLKDRDAQISNRSTDMYSLFSQALGYGDFKKLDKGSFKRFAVLDSVAKCNKEIQRRAGYTSDQKTLNKIFYEVIGDQSFLREAKLFEGSAQTQEQVADNIRLGIDNAKVTQGEEQASGAYALTNSRSGYMSYSHDLAGYEKLRKEGSILGREYQWQKEKHFLNSFTTEELQQLKKDQEAKKAQEEEQKANAKMEK